MDLPRKIFVQIREVNKANSLTLSQPVLILLPSKKTKKQGNKDLSQVGYYACYKKDHYTNKYLDKKLKN